ncbi:MAG: YgjP-like metallopeptidase domain-containing protein [Candidatus Accumulibacter sp. UW26]|jgi:predicted metal-dependent hydrolase
MLPLKYLAGYPEEVQNKVREAIRLGQLAAMLRTRYPGRHQVRSDEALYEYALALKNCFLRNAEAPVKVVFDNRLHITANALGINGRIPRVQGNRVKSRREIRVASLFKEVPPEFLRMIVVHELAHLKEREHDRAFYQLCRHMEPDYEQLEFDLRLYLTQVDLVGWSAPREA